jgi:hypothetical protein
MLAIKPDNHTCRGADTGVSAPTGMIVEFQQERRTGHYLWINNRAKFVEGVSSIMCASSSVQDHSTHRAHGAFPMPVLS